MTLLRKVSRGRGEKSDGEWKGSRSQTGDAGVAGVASAAGVVPHQKVSRGRGEEAHGGGMTLLRKVSRAG